VRQAGEFDHRGWAADENGRIGFANRQVCADHLFVDETLAVGPVGRGISQGVPVVLESNGYGLKSKKYMKEIHERGREY
jgi:hypothetical protein